MEFAVATTFSQLLLGILSLKGDIDTFLSALQFLFKSLVNIICLRLLQIPQPCPCQHFYFPPSSCNNSTSNISESRGGARDDESSFGRNMSVSEVSEVMKRLGLELNVWVEGGEGNIGLDLASLFEEVEPSLEELRMAFEVFDSDKDGYVDAGDLQRVFCELGLKEENDDDRGLEECKKMIRRFGRNGDGGVIDFADFVRLMEKCLC